MWKNVVRLFEFYFIEWLFRGLKNKYKGMLVAHKSLEVLKAKYFNGTFIEADLKEERCSGATV